MRISTQAFYASSLAAMLDQQVALSRIQNQVATGKRVSTPADDPIAAVHILELERAQTESGQFDRNSNIARARLSLEEQALADTTTLLQRVRELTVQAANTGAMTDADRRSVAVELGARLQELRDIANSQDGTGDYLFAGFASGTQPFARVAGNVVYLGDQGSRLVQVGPSQRVADGDSGYDIFMNIPEGNGTFVTSAGAANTGGGVINTGVITDNQAWVPGSYTLSFTSPTAWQVVDGSNAVVATGAYAAGDAIEFNGVQVTISGAPATGDSFTVRSAGTTSMFAMLDSLVTALGQPAPDMASRARLSTAINGALQQIDQSSDHLSTSRAQVGSRLSLIDNAENARGNLTVDIAESLAGLRDLDYAAAVTRMNQQLVGLQAAQQSYIKISQLSLFNYL